MKTVKRHFTALRQYWTFLLARGHVNENIFTLFSFPGTSTNKRRRHNWTPEALDKLFRSSWWRAGTDRETVRWWGPLILLHMGLRREELCQLMPSDIRERDGIPYIDRHKEAAGAFGRQPAAGKLHNRVSSAADECYSAGPRRQTTRTASNTVSPLLPKPAFQVCVALDRRRGNELGNARFFPPRPTNGSNPCLKRCTMVTTFSTTGG